MRILANNRYLGHLFSILFIQDSCNLSNFQLLKSFHTKVRASNRIGPHNQDVLSVIIGSLLGDAYANARTIEGTRICYRQSDKHMDYLL